MSLALSWTSVPDSENFMPGYLSNHHLVRVEKQQEQAESTWIYLDVITYVLRIYSNSTYQYT